MRTLQGIALGLLASAWARDAPAKVKATPIAELIRSADAIVLAKVVTVGDGGGRRSAQGTVAVAEVMESWKGDAGKTVKFSVEKTWHCDVSGAVVHEQAVLILDWRYKRPERVRVLPGVHFLSFSGRGRMPIVNQSGKAFAHVQGEVLLPKGDFESSRAPDFPGDNLVALDDLRAYVKTILTPPAAAITPTPASTAGEKAAAEQEGEPLQGPEWNLLGRITGFRSVVHKKAGLEARILEADGSATVALDPVTLFLVVTNIEPDGPIERAWRVPRGVTELAG